MVNYPQQLDGPLLSGYTLNQKTNLLRSDMESGLAVSRVRFTNVSSTMASTWLFDEEQAALFEIFIDEDLHGGLLWFEMPIKTPAGIQTAQLRFVTDPRENCSPTSITHWQYKADIEVKSRFIKETA